MSHCAREVATRAVAAVAAVALAVVAGATVAGCATAAATATTRPAATTPAATQPAIARPATSPPATTRTATSPPAAARTAAPVYGPPSLDAACSAAVQAERTLRSRQGKDQYDESALDQDFMHFGSALSAAAQREQRPATAQAMTALANDYTALVESQSGAVQLPDMSQVQKDGAAFDKACSP